MLRIHVVPQRAGTALRVEGRLAGPFVRELAACWEALLAEPRSGLLRVDLHGVTFIDTAGKELLRTMHEQGAELAASECMTRAIVEEIAAGCGPPPAER
jgi:anti-anti-sigma regulatory factor